MCAYTYDRPTQSLSHCRAQFPRPIPPTYELGVRPLYFIRVTPVRRIRVPIVNRYGFFLLLFFYILYRRGRFQLFFQTLVSLFEGTEPGRREHVRARVPQYISQYHTARCIQYNNNNNNVAPYCSVLRPRPIKLCGRGLIIYYGLCI